MRVLVIDDERLLADTLALILRNEGYEAAAAYDGPAALSQIETFLPDFVISDVIMPGYEWNRGVRENTGGTSRLPHYSVFRPGSYQ